jgi:predicted dinucleotide-binding enzyme
MRIAILGSGSVAETLTRPWHAAGHELVLGARDRIRAQDRDWVRAAGDSVRVLSLEEAAAAGEVVVNATTGATSLAMLRELAQPLAGKTLLDVSNAIAFGAEGMALLYPNTSVAEQIQRALPGVRVVKSLNTFSVAIMADPTGLPIQTTVFMSGDDGDAKRTVCRLLMAMGWPAEAILDLGGIATARGPEHYFFLMIAQAQAVGTSKLNIATVH